MGNLSCLNISCNFYILSTLSIEYASLPKTSSEFFVNLQSFPQYNASNYFSCL